ncbi:chromosome segregation protein SMC [Alkalibaculum sp. M08DMB]|uniref:Chromosome partition protein Smc n=1 Tax=Alkalibaculum sporogenes TaxID=2655001 RepID=A0A6A7K9M0_9FIRM|nr:chromosome segregation protein SMC [Alkalibaculum sporogenes]MPW26055.1 chromosome segregation protein SMC [Alkalibaculum sporogenes]
MYLKKLEIFGFKSFADKVDIEFKDGITAIVGPNGSGKSNVSDAIKWVLGEQRIKYLRGSKMEDVIFSGTKVRKSLGYAQVSLTIDNESGVFPIEYTEISVTRRLYRSGDSEYYINKSLCRLKDIQDLFLDTGLGKEGYSIIGQGKIDHIVSSNPQDRRLILEEATGIVKYKNRKLESERKLEKTQDNLYRITDIISELEKQLPSLEKQAKKALSYLDLRENLKKVELNLFIHKVDIIKEELNKLYFDRDNIVINIKEKGIEISNKDLAFQDLRKKILKLDETINNLNQKKLELSEINQKSNTQIQVSRTKIEHNKSSILTIEDDILQTEYNNKNLEGKINYIEDSISKITEEIYNKSKELEYLHSQKNTKENIVQTQLEKFKNKNEKLQLINNDLQTYSNKITILENKNFYNEETFKNLFSRLEGLNELVKENKNTKDQCSTTKVDLERNLSSTRELETIKKREISFIQDKLDKLKKELSIYENNYNMISSKYTLMNNNEDLRGYVGSVKELLREKKNNALLKNKLHDIVGNLVDVPKKYALAIETSLGNTIHNLITEDEDIAHECIKILNKNKWGRATFLPLNIIKGQALNIENSIALQKGYIGLACNLVNFDKRYTGIFHNLLGKVLIVEDINVAKVIHKKCNYKYKIVTLQGEIFFPGGAIVGGIHKNGNVSIIQRKQEIEDLKINIEKSQNNIGVLKSELEKLQSSLTKNKEELRLLEYKANQFSTEKQLIEQKLSQIQVLIDNETKNIISLQSQIETIKESKGTDIEEFNSLHEKIKALNISKSELELIEVIQVDEKLNMEIIELSKEIMEINLYIAKQEEKHIHLSEQLNDYSHAINENKNKIYAKNNEKANLINENKVLQNLIDENNELLMTFDAEKNNISSDYERLQNERISNNLKIDVLQETLKELNNQNVLINEGLSKIEIKINNKNSELEHLQNNIFECYEMNYSMALDYKYPINNINNEVKTMKNFKTQISELGTVNVGAMDQYKEIKERFEFLSFQKDDLVKAKDALSDIITEISSNMKSQFIEQFNLIEKEFQETFKKLFNGGTARLRIENPESIMETGIEIEVQPPGKNLKNISLLSGGEKSLTAIALLFAIISIKPTPFCVLDEIDAALDDSNVERFSNFLQLVSKDNQFITITHRKGTMEIADRLYGISMGQDGVSKVVSVEIK